MPSILQVLASKGSHVWSISPDATVFAGLTLMAEKNIGALLIIENDKPVGIMSERDYARKIILEGRSSRDTRIRSIMTTRLVWAHPSDSVEHAMALMTRERIRHLPCRGWRLDPGSGFDRRSREGDDRSAAVHHRTARAVHH